MKIYAKQKLKQKTQHQITSVMRTLPVTAINVCIKLAY